MSSCPENWSNCVMHVQDMISPSTNITAEISKRDMDNFVNMCRMFLNYLPQLNDT